MITKEEFIKRSKKIHGDKYDYSLVNFKKVTDKVCIICPVHGEFWQEARSHYRGLGCPKCGIEIRSEKKTKPKELFIKKAKEIFGDEYDFSNINYVNTKTKIKLYCKKHGYFEIDPHEMIQNKRGCPKCGREKMAKKLSLTKEEFIERSKKIHNYKYNYSKVEYKNNRTEVIITCPIHGDFTQKPDVHLNGHECPECAKIKRAKAHTNTSEQFIEKAKKIHGDKYDYSLVDYKNAFTPISIICKKHGIFKQLPTYHLCGNGCQKCGVTNSNAENEIYDFCKKYIDNVEHSNRTIISPYEIDIYIPEKQIGIEYNGILWHSLKYKADKNYHLNKLNLCKEKGIKLIQIFEDEYENNKEIVLSKIKHLLKINENLPKIMGRKCVVKEIKNCDAKDFLTINHIQGFSPSTLHIGAYFKDKLIAVMSFKCETNGSDKWELTRFASDNSVICQGVGGKLLNYFIKKYNPSYIKSFADRRWTINEENNMYVKIGFKFDGYTSPDYKYFKPSDGIKRQHKFGFRKQILHRKYNLPLSMTEREMTEKLGYKKIYDCGLIRYVWKKEKADN